MNTKSYKSFKSRLLKNKEIKRAYEALEPEFLLAKMIIFARIQQGITQKEIAKKIGTKQSAISRLESGDYNPSFAFLRKVAGALDLKLKVSLEKQ